MMKKLFLYTGIVALLMLLFTFKSARASGILLEGLGTRAVTMGGAFIGLADDSSAIYWNPAGLGRLKGSEWASGVYSMSTFIRDRNSASNLYPYQQNPNKGDIFPRVYPTEPTRFNNEDEFWPSCATIPAITAYKNFENFTMGGGIYAIGGNYSKWNDSLIDSTNANIDAAIRASMAIVAFNVSVAKKVTDKLSLGMGMDILYARIKGSIDKNYRGSSDPQQLDYEVRLESESDGMGLQGTMGILYEFSPQWSIGAVYRTGAKFDLNGDTYARMTVFGPDGKPITNLEEESDHHHEFVFPPSWGIGIAYKPTPRLTLATDWQRVDWTKFNWPFGNIHYNNPGVLLKNTVIDPDWYPSNGYRFGWEYKYTSRLTLRGGYCFEDSGIPGDGEDITLISIGNPIQYANVGFGYKWDIWNLDFMLGTMWGDSSGGVSHRCYDLSFTFTRPFGGESEKLPGSRATGGIETQQSFFYKELNIAPEYFLDEGHLKFRDVDAGTSLGFEYFRIFSGEYGDWLTTDLQVRFPIMGHRKRALRNAYANFNLNFDFDQKELEDILTTETMDPMYEIHNAYANFKLNAGRSNIKIGHFDVPFGLEPLIDTHSTLLQTQATKNIGFKKDWGLSVNGALPSFNYEAAATLGCGGTTKIWRKDGSYLLSGRIGTPTSEDFQYGFSLLYGRVLPALYDDYLFKNTLNRKRVGLDSQYSTVHISSRGKLLMERMKTATC